MRKALKRFRAVFRAGPRSLGERYTGPKKRKTATGRAFLWIYIYFARHFTPIGACIFAVSLIYSELILQASDRSPSHIPAFTILSLFMTSYMAGYFMRPAIKVKRRVPPSVSAGEELKISYDLLNESDRPVWDIVLDMLPLPAGLKYSQGRASIESLPPNQKESAYTYLKALQRGKYILPEVRADTSFPFYIWRWGCPGHGGRQLTVHPFFVPLHSLDMTFGIRYQPGGVAYSSNVGSSLEFLGCREYCYGDDIKHIHWRSWARVGEPVVREYREEYLCRTALILDTRRTSRASRFRSSPDVNFEAAVSLTASIAAYLARSEYLVELFAAGPQVYRFKCGRSLAYLEDILDVLSCLETHPDEPMDDLISEIESERLKLSSAILVLLHWDKARQKLLESLDEAGVALKVILVTKNGKNPAGAPDTVMTVSESDVREGKCLDL